MTLVNFLGGAHNGTVVNPNVTTDKEMVEIIHGELKGLIGDENTSVPLMSRPVPVLDAQGEALPLKKQAHVLGIRRWMKGIPQYTRYLSGSGCLIICVYVMFRIVLWDIHGRSISYWY